MAKNQITLCSFLLMIVLVGCSKDSPTTPTSEQDWQEAWDAKCAIQHSAWGVYDSLVVDGDTTAAIEAAISYLEGNANQVEWAVYNGEGAICIRYKDGGEGGIVIYVPTLRNSNQGTHNAWKISQIGSVIPTKEGAIYCNPFYSDEELRPSFDHIYSTMSSELARVDFPSPELIPDWQVTPSTLASLSNRGVIHLNFHAILFKSVEGDTLKIYYLLSVPAHASLTNSLPENLRNFPVPFDITPEIYPGIDTVYTSYGIPPEFLKIANQTNWAVSKPVIWGGFCWSFLGSWPQTMIDAGASCYIGWDGKVFIGQEEYYANKFYEFMCDTPAHDPFITTVGAYFCDTYSQGQVDPNWTGIPCMAGDPFTSFQEVVETGWRAGSYQLTFDEAYALYDNENNRVLLDFMPSGELYPQAHLMMSAWELEAGMPVLLSTVIVYIGVGVTYDNYFYTSNPLPCYVTYTELDLQQLGKVSGFVWGYVKDHFHPNSSPVPIQGNFDNVTVYTGSNIPP